MKFGDNYNFDSIPLLSIMLGRGNLLRGKMKKYIIQIIITITIILSISTTSTAETRGFLPPEGLIASITNYVKNAITNPELIYISFDNTWTFTDFTDESSIYISTADTIHCGWANMWSYGFLAETGAELQVNEVANNMGDVSIYTIGSLSPLNSPYIKRNLPPMFSTTTPLPAGLDWQTATAFANQLVKNEEFIDACVKDNGYSKSHNDGIYVLITLGTAAENNPINMVPGTVYWMACVIEIERDSDNSERLKEMHYCFADAYTLEMNCNVISGILEPTVSNKINVYPNPAKGIVNIDVRDEIVSEIELIDVNGHLLKTYDGSSITLDLSRANAGSYYLCFTINKVKYFKVIIVGK